MKRNPIIGKRDFIQNTSKYLKLAHEVDKIIITHHNKPVLIISPIEEKSLSDLQGLIKHVKVKGDINDPIFPGYDEW